MAGNKAAGDALTAALMAMNPTFKLSNSTSIFNRPCSCLEACIPLRLKYRLPQMCVLCLSRHFLLKLNDYSLSPSLPASAEVILQSRSCLLSFPLIMSWLCF